MIRSPLDGIVTSVPVEVGQAIQPATTIAEIIDPDPMLAVGAVSERARSQLKVGQKASVRFIDGREVRGSVSYVGLSADKATRTYPVETTIGNADASIPDGVTCEMVVDTEPVEAASIPRSALVFSDDGELGVRYANDESRVGFMPVSIIDDGRETVWVAGIDRATQVIVVGQDFVKEGDLVETVSAVAAGGAGRMRRIVDFAVDHARLTIAILIFLLLAGVNAYMNIPKEAEPDITVPIIYVQLSQNGISPEDAERLLVRPVESSLKSVTNVKEMRAAAFEGGGYVLLEFEAGFNSDTALQDVRAKVDDAKAKLPSDADEPRVQEVNLSLLPVIVVTLGGNMSERTLNRLAHQAQDAIELVPGVLSATLQGLRDEVVEIIAEPMLLKSYGVSLDQFAVAAAQGNSLVAAGALEGNQGRFAIKVPALIETPEDVLNIPIAASSAASVTLGDVAKILPTFKDATSVTRVNGQPAVAIEVSKRAGANLIETVDGVKATIENLKKTWPEAVDVQFLQDKSTMIKQILADLQNAVLTAVILVAVIILFFLGGRASLFIGIAIPLRLPDRHPRPLHGRADDEHRRPVQPDPRRRHAGRRRDHRLGVRRTAHERRHAAARGLSPSRQAA